MGGGGLKEGGESQEGGKGGGGKHMRREEYRLYNVETEHSKRQREKTIGEDLQAKERRREMLKAVVRRRQKTHGETAA